MFCKATKYAANSCFVIGGAFSVSCSLYLWKQKLLTFFSADTMPGILFEHFTYVISFNVHHSFRRKVVF